MLRQHFLRRIFSHPNRLFCSLDIKRNISMSTVLVPIADGSEEIETTAIVDTLRRGGFNVFLASVAASETVTCSRGIKIVADGKIGDCVGKSYDVIALPGGMPGAEKLRDCPELVELLKQQHQQGKWCAAVCASPAVVFETHGLLTGKKATCHPNFVKHLTDQSAAEQRVVVDGHIITSRAPGTAIEFALEIIRHVLGEEKLKQVAAPMLVAGY